MTCPRDKVPLLCDKYRIHGDNEFWKPCIIGYICIKRDICRFQQIINNLFKYTVRKFTYEKGRAENLYSYEKLKTSFNIRKKANAENLLKHLTAS